jgi:hypothetical protein
MGRKFSPRLYPQLQLLLVGVFPPWRAESIMRQTTTPCVAADGAGSRSMVSARPVEPPHPARGVHPEPLRCAQGRSQRKGERARHPLPQGGEG